ncbi:MAG: hypothetical protein L0K86_19815 [Actinomycetia bacterium]|nr:hypothetical protein [Actinomycetes bacterium]
MRLTSEANALYATLPEEFVASRNARAKEVRADGDRDLADRIRKLPKPRTSAWVLNMLVQRHRDEVDDLIALGGHIRNAQAGSDDSDLHDLHRERRRVTAALAQRARAVAYELGYEVGDEMAAEVENTLRAAMADAAGAAALRTGQLIATFGNAGFEPVDLAQIVAVPDDVTVPPAQDTDVRPKLRSVREPKKQPRKAKAAPRTTPRTTPRATTSEALGQARHSFEAADRDLKRADRSLADATKDREDLDAEKALLQQRLRSLEQELFGAHRAEDAADRKQQHAAKAYADAKRALERAERDAGA